MYNQRLYSLTYNINSIKNLLIDELKDHIDNIKIINPVLKNINIIKRKDNKISSNIVNLKIYIRYIIFLL